MLSLTAPPFVPGALELDDGWADNARRIGPDGAPEAHSPQRKIQRRRTGSRSSRESSASDLSEDAFDAAAAVLESMRVRYPLLTFEELKAIITEQSGGGVGGSSSAAASTDGR